MKAVAYPARGRSWRRSQDFRGNSDRQVDRLPGPGRRRGFTLIEILVVITIIAILAALTGPVSAAVMRKVRELQANHAATELTKAIHSYSSEYRRWPLPRAQASRDVETDSGESLMGVLMASDKERGPGGLNPRGEPFFSGRQASGKNPPRHGVDYEVGGAGALYDPWGQPYRVILDADRDGRCRNPLEPGKVVVKTVLVWSCGPNGEDDRGGEDDVALW